MHVFTDLRTLWPVKWLKFSETVFGMVFNLEENNVGCVILGDADTVKEGDVVERTKKVMSIPVGENMLGRVVDPLGNPIDGAGEIQTTGTRPVERIAPGVCDRQPVAEPLQTGIKSIDMMIPIGRGQRELIIGDEKLVKQQSPSIQLSTKKNQTLFVFTLRLVRKNQP